MNPAEVLEVLERNGAVQRGHFRLTSGRHSDLFAQKFRVLEHPRLAQVFGDEIARSFAGEFDVVASPAVGALVLGFTTALAADARFIFTERVDGAMALRRGFRVASGERVLVVEDVVTTGGSVQEVVTLVGAAGAELAGVGALVDRTDPHAAPDFGAPFRALVRLDASSWPADECPLCLRQEPIVEPGSSRLTA